MTNPRLKSIAELLDGNHHFLIPSYQRGYRWEKQQITDLLNDILEFQKEIQEKKDRVKTSGEFYCLQPIIVLKKGEKWEVIDGQQRLTTIYILLSYLKDRFTDYGNPKLFSIEYETREKENCSSKTFLEDITSISERGNKTNIDFYHMSNAFFIIKEWFENVKPPRGKFCDTLFENKEDSNNVRFIWYELDTGGDKPNVAFAKYNQGKIDLTNAELIKAIFYISNDYMEDGEKKKHQLNIGYEWDNIENTLRKNDFWKFINPDEDYINHIEFIFDLIAAKYYNCTKLEINKSIDKYWSFHIFNKLIMDNIEIYEIGRYNNVRDFLWDEIKTYYRTFIEWYNDNEYYHLIGFLLQIGKKVENIKELAEKSTKEVFKEDLHKMIKRYFGEINFNEIGYEDSHVRNLLFLFNLITTMKSDNRFPFDKFKEKNWSLEHIHAQLSEGLNDKQKRILLQEQQDYLSKHNYNCNRKDLVVDIDNLLNATTIEPDKFTDIQNKIFKEYSTQEETGTISDSNAIDSIKNLALLATPDNSCLNNNIFPIKRDLIKKLDEKGSFIPICTKNVFLKYYSKDVEQNVRWDDKDMEAYLIEMKKVLEPFIEEKKDGY